MDRHGIFWIASYPKSGNTWLRGFLAAYLNEQGALDLDNLGIPVCANRALLDDLLSLDTADLTEQEGRDLLPRAFEAWHACPGLPRFAKTHDAYGRTRDGEPVFPAEVTRGVACVVRDPRDVAVSMAPHYGISLDQAIERLNDPGAWIGRGAGERMEQIPQFVSDWSGHAQSWLDSGLPLLRLRYEDMLADPAASFTRLLEFAGLKVDPARLGLAIEAASFESLRAREQARGFVERRAGSTAPFFRQGRSGAWQNALSPAQVDLIQGRHRRMMRQFGYLD